MSYSGLRKMNLQQVICENGTSHEWAFVDFRAVYLVLGYAREKMIVDCRF